MKEGWEEKKLGDVCKKNSNIKWQKNDETEYQYIDLSSVSRDSLTILETSVVSSKNAPSRAKKIVEEDDVIFATTRPTLRRVTIIEKDLDNQICSTGFAVMRANSEKILPQFIFYFLQTEYFIERMETLQRGASYPAVSDTDVNNSLIPIPPLSEQKEIVATLDEAFAAIDTAKYNIKKNIENANELFQSRLNDIFSRKGEGWEEKRLGDVCENLDRMRIPITKNIRKSGNIPYYGASGIVDYVDDYIFDEDLLLVSEDGANLLARTYPIAFSISGKSWVNNHAHVLKFKNISSQIFIEYYLNSIKLDDYVSGMAQPKLNQKMLNSITVPYPTIDIQEKIVSQLDLLNEDLEDINEKYQQKLSNLEDLKQSLLQKAFAGELT